MNMEGLKSFHLDCHTNDNISELEGEFGIMGFGIIVRLWQKIYAEKGYYCEWVKRSPLLFLSNWFGGNSGVSLNLINEVVSRALRIGLFDEGLYEKYSILTSERIQRQFFEAIKRRKEVKVISEYLLISVDNFRDNVNIFSISAYKNTKNVYRNEQRKEKKSKVKESKENKVLCSELSADGESSEPQAAKEKPVILLPLNTKEDYPIYQADVDEWSELYPSVDVMQQLRNMKGWLDSNPTRRKTPKGIKRFITNWLQREQDKGGMAKDGGKSSAYGKKTDNRFRNFDERSYTPEELDSMALELLKDDMKGG